MFSNWINKLSTHWFKRFIQTSVVYVSLMAIALIIGSLIAQKLVFNSSMLLIMVIVLTFNIVISLFYYFKLHYLYILTSNTLGYASFASVLLTIENFNGSGYFQGIVSLVLFLAVAFAIGIVIHVSMYLLFGERSTVTIQQDQPLLKKLLIAYNVLLLMITAIIIYTVIPTL